MSNQSEDQTGTKTILVTGALGYVASHCMVELLKAGFEVIAMDNFANHPRGKSPEEKPECLKRVEKLGGKPVSAFYDVDVTDYEKVKAAMENHVKDPENKSLHCVIHCAALKSVSECFKDPLLYYETNVMGSLNVLKACRDLGVNRFVFSSSSTAYGKPDYLPIDENHKAGNCDHTYGRTKYFVEEMMKDLARSNPDFRLLSLRYFNPIGAHPSGEIGEDPLGVPNNLMPFIAQVAVGRRDKLNVFGNDYTETADGTAVRDYIHVMDVADSHVLAVKAVTLWSEEKWNEIADKENPAFKVYNLGRSEGFTVLQIVEAFEKANGVKIPYEFAPRRRGDIAMSYCSGELMEKEFGWKPTRGLEEMCKDMWTWQTKNPQGYVPGNN